MEFLFKNKTLFLESEKKIIEFLSDRVNLDGLLLEMPGEYEKSGFLAYTIIEGDTLITHVTVEGHHIGYIPSILGDLSSTTLDFLGDLDLLVMPTAKSSVALLEKIEPRMLVTFGGTAHELATAMGISEPATLKYKLKEADMSLEKMGVIVMGE